MSILDVNTERMNVVESIFNNTAVVVEDVDQTKNIATTVGLLGLVTVAGAALVITVGALITDFYNPEIISGYFNVGSFFLQVFNVN